MIYCCDRTTRGRSTATKKEEPKPVAAKPVTKSPSNQKGIDIVFDVLLSCHTVTVSLLGL